MVILAGVGESHAPERIVAEAYALGTAFDDEVKVVHVIPEDEADEHFDELRNLSEFADIGFDIEKDRAREVAQKMIDVALEEYDSDVVSPVGRVGDPREELLGLAAREDPRYIVIGGRKRSPTGKALFGSVTQSIVLNSDWPVVTIMAAGNAH